MKAAVVHAIIDEIGGGERLVAHIANVLRSSGWSVEVYAARVDQSVAERLGISGIRILKCGAASRFAESLLRASGRFVRLRRLLLLKGCLEELEKLKEDFDVVFETQSNVLPPVDVAYIHFPARLDYTGGEGFLRALYNWAISRTASSIESSGHPRLVLTNSTWTRRMIFRAYGDLVVPVNVLHPPVRVEFFGEVWYRPFSEREKLVVTVSRFTPEKRLESMVEVARRLPDYRFVIAGSTAGYSKPVIERIRRAAEEASVSNVEIETDLSDEEIRNVLGKARFYLHPPFAEHFGIAIAEAMAAGAIPIVYRDGGGWTDLVSSVDEGLGYSSIEEVEKIISEMSAERAEEVRLKAWRHVSKFSEKNFAEKLLRIVESLPRREP